MGRGPIDVKASMIRVLVLVRLKGVLTPAERQLAKSAEGIEMVKAMRQNLISQGREKLCTQVSEITGITVSGLFADIDVSIGERIIMFSLDQDLETSFPLNILSHKGHQSVDTQNFLSQLIRLREKPFEPTVRPNHLARHPLLPRLLSPGFRMFRQRLMMI